MNGLRMLGLASTLAALGLVGCEGSGTTTTLESKTPEERVEAVESAISKPTGEVNAAHAQFVLESSQGQAQFEAMEEFLGGVPGLSSGSGAAACSTGTNSDGKVDLSCSSDGAMSGSVTWSVSTSSTKQLVEVKFEDVCDEKVCLDGSLVVAVETTTSGEVSTIVQASLDRTEGGETIHGEWGTVVNVKPTGGTSVDVVVFDDEGGSYVVSASVDGSSSAGQVTITGANGEFSCEYDGGGESGSCSGSGEISW